MSRVLRLCFVPVRLAGLPPLLTGALVVSVFAVGWLGPLPTAKLPSASAAAVSDISAGGAHTCAVRPSGQAFCWGWNKFGQLGTRSFANQVTPTPVRGLANTRALSAGSAYTCAIRSSGQGACWGNNDIGTLGDGTRISRRFPTRVKRLPGASVIDAGLFNTCAVRRSGRAACWGSSGSELGAGPGYSFGTRKTPIQVKRLDDAVDIGVGLFFGCAARASGQAVCWGFNNDGEVGDGSTRRRWVPTPVHGLPDVSAVSAGYFHVCAIRSTGQALCWGSNRAGTLGSGSQVRRARLPVPVAGLSDAIAISAGIAHTCALRVSGRVACWGENNGGQLGDRTRRNRRTPVEVVGLTDAIAISAGGAHTCAIRASGEPVCWGWNKYGELGDGTRRTRLSPTTVVFRKGGG